MKTQLLLGVLGLVAMMVGCAAPSIPEEGKKSSTSKMRTDDWEPSSNVEDRRNDPPGTQYPDAPQTPDEPVDTSPGSLADQAGINDIDKNSDEDEDNGDQDNGDQDNGDQDNGDQDNGDQNDGGGDDGGGDDSGGGDDGGGGDD